MTEPAAPPRPAAAADNVGEAANADNNNQPERNNNNVPQHPLLNVRDRLFHALFYRMATVYAHAVPAPLRTAVEYCALFMVGIYSTFIYLPACVYISGYWHQEGADKRLANLPRGNQDLLMVKDEESPSELLEWSSPWNVVLFPSIPQRG